MSEELLVTRQLVKRFGGVRALDCIDVVQHRGETLGMIGPNGSGKTSFVNAITGHLALDGGRILFSNRDLSGAKPHEIVEAGIVRTYQAVRVFAKLSVRTNLEASLLLTKQDGKALNSDAAREILEWLRLDRNLDAIAGELSLFEQRRLELAMRLLLRPKLIMLDEPVGGLAPGEIKTMIGVLTELKARCTIFVIEHTMKVIRELADRVIVLIAGEKIADGPPLEILKDARVIKHYLGSAHA